MIELTSKQRKFLEKNAQPLSALVQIGGTGLTEEQIKQIDRLLTEHELIKIKFNEFKDEKRDLASDISKNTDATLVRIIGNVAIFYRPSDDEDSRAFEKQLSKI